MATTPPEEVAQDSRFIQPVALPLPPRASGLAWTREGTWRTTHRSPHPTARGTETGHLPLSGRGGGLELPGTPRRSNVPHRCARDHREIHVTA